MHSIACLIHVVETCDKTVGGYRRSQQSMFKLFTSTSLTRDSGRELVAQASGPRSPHSPSRKNSGNPTRYTNDRFANECHVTQLLPWSGTHALHRSACGSPHPPACRAGDTALASRPRTLCPCHTVGRLPPLFVTAHCHWIVTKERDRYSTSF